MPWFATYTEERKGNVRGQRTHNIFGGKIDFSGRMGCRRYDSLFLFLKSSNQYSDAWNLLLA